MINSLISNIYDGRNKAYIYIWFSKRHRFVYVGMTNSKHGVLGRALNHFSSTGTLRTNFLDRKGYNIEETQDLRLLSFALPQKNEYIMLETSYRESVEYLVQKQLIESRIELKPRFKILSKVRFNDRVQEKEVKLIASNIISDFKKEYLKAG